MNITQEKIDDLNAVIKIHLLPEDYKPSVTEELKKYARKASIPGFRPGKVPMSLVKKMVGVGVVVDTVSKTLQEQLQGYIEKNKIDLVGDPLPKEKRDESYFDINCNKELTFDFEVGLAPEFSLDLNFKDPIPLYEVEIDDAFLDKEIEDLRDRHAELEYPEEAAKGDIIFGKLVEKGKGEDEEAFSKMVALNPKKIENEALFAQFEGKKIEDLVPFSLSDLGDDAAIATALTMEADELPEIKGKDLEFVVKRISRLGLAPLEEALFKKVFGEDTDVTDEAAFKAKLAEGVAKQMANQAKFVQRGEIKKQIEATHELNLPVEFLKKWMKETNEGKVTDENVDQEYTNLEQSLKWSLIVEKIQADFPESKIESNELEDEIKAKLRQNFDEDIDEEMEKQYVEYIMKNEQMLKDYYYRILDDKIFGALADKVTSKSEKITATALMEKLEAEREANQKA